MNDTKLKPITFGLNTWCGPSVISALTGKSTDECAAAIAAISGSREVKRVSWDHLVKTLEKLRFVATKEKTYSYSLFGTLNELAAKAAALYLIGVPGHVVAVEVTDDNKIFIVDNSAKVPLPAEGSARLTQKVDLVYKLVPKELPKFLRKEVKVSEKYAKTISIEVIDVYENEEDNVKYSKGYIYFRDEKELTEIYSKLTELLERKANESIILD